MCASLGPTSLGLSELPGLPESLFTVPDWGSSPSLFFQISFPLLFLFSFWHLYDSDVGKFNVVPEVPNPVLIFFEFLFLHSVSVECFFLPSAPNPWTESQFPSHHSWFCVHFPLIHFTLSSILQLYLIISLSNLITSVLNSASDSLAISSLLSSIFRVLICCFIWTILLCLGAPVM